MTRSSPVAFKSLTGVYEPSAVVQLPDGRFLVAEDEQDHPLSVVRIEADGTVSSTALRPGLLQTFSAFWQLDDLEGLAVDRAGWVYAITSHSRDDKGRQQDAREKLVRFRIEGDNVVDRKVVDGLKRSMTTTFPVLAAAAKLRDVKAGGGLNIEGLALSPDQSRLLVGFRSPLQDGCALVASLDNLPAVFEAGEAPRLSSRLDMLDLDGHGIRGLSYIASLSGYLVIGGPVDRADEQFGLWFWSGHAGARACRATVPGLTGLRRAEGVSPATIDGAERIVIVSDDGDRKKGRSAHYLLLDPAQLEIAAQ
jgi:Protein of unknown function (DUF3616)